MMTGMTWTDNERSVNMETRGKHEAAQPMNEALEQHYKQRIKDLEESGREADRLLNDANLEIRRLKFDIEMHENHIKELEEAFLTTAIEAAMAKKGMVKA